MTTEPAVPPPEEPPAPEWEDERRFLDERIAAGTETVAAVWVFALIPLGLVYLFLRGILGPYAGWLGWLGYLFPVAPFLAILLVAVWHRWRSEMPLHPRDHAILTGSRKRRALVQGGIIIAALAALAIWGPVLEQALLRTLRAWLLDWRI